MTDPRLFDAATNALSKARREMWRMNTRVHESEELSEEDYDPLADSIMAFRRALLVIFDKEGLGNLRDELATGWADVSGNLREIKHFNDEPDYAYSPAIDYLAPFLVTISPLYSVSDVNTQKIEIAEQIVMNGSHLVYLEGKQIAKEKDVHDAILKYVRVAFPSTINRPKVSQQTKTYEPDIGVTSLQYAIEVKYATTKSDLVRCVGEIYTDIKGYGGTPEWLSFIGVIYTTSAALTQQMVDAEGARVGADPRWKLKIVHIPAAQSAPASAKKPSAAGSKSLRPGVARKK